MLNDPGDKDKQNHQESQPAGLFTQAFPAPAPAPSFLIEMCKEVTVSLNFCWEADVKGLIDQSGRLADVPHFLATTS